MQPSRRQRVLIYGMNYSPEPIGVGRYSGELGAYLSDQGVDVDVVTAIPHYPGWSARDGYRNRYQTERVGGGLIVRCPLLLKSEMRGIWRLLAPLSFAASSTPVAMWRLIVARPDVMLCVEPTLLSAAIATFFAKLLGVRRVLHVQDLEIDAAFAMGHIKAGYLQKAAQFVERLVLRGFDRVVTISNRMQEKLVAKGVAPERLLIVRNWVHLDKIGPLQRRSAYRDEMKLSDDVFVVLYAGNVGQKQGLSVLLDAAERLADELQLIFVIAGDGPEKKRLQDRYGHLTNILYLPVQPEHRLCELLNLADVHVLPQDRGAADLVLPSKLGGMLASGKPSIVLADPSTELFTFVGGGAIVLAPGNSVLLADTLKNLFSDRSLCAVEDNRERIASLDAKKNLSAFRDILFMATGNVAKEG